jgi:hypothetical protein
VKEGLQTVGDEVFCTSVPLNLIMISV